VKTVLRSGDRINLLDDRFIQSLKAREEHGLIVRSSPIQKPCAPYQAGQQVEINGGPFDGVVAKILAVEANDRLVVLMDLLQNSVRTHVNAAQVISSPHRDRELTGS
ncbi:MAG: transcription termination/antitermination protein NusG, partial [Hyphomicrobiaceae bacterium]